jgi:hypothetical protein
MNNKNLAFLSLFFLLISCGQSKSRESVSAPVNAESYLLYEEQAMKVIQQTKEVLGKNLMEAMRSGGVDNAVSFCSERALELSDSIGKVNDVIIRRVAEKNRNPKNAAKVDDLAYMVKVETLMEHGGEPVQAWLDKGNIVEIRQPIFMEELCLNCHGKVNENILPANYESIKKYYPEDKAVGFELQSLRGIWVVEIKK